MGIKDEHRFVMAEKMLFTRLQKKRQRVDPQTLMELGDSASRVARAIRAACIERAPARVAFRYAAARVAARGQELFHKVGIFPE
jgi:hypothetical protein